jgi:hypothetical protein
MRMVGPLCSAKRAFPFCSACLPLLQAEKEEWLSISSRAFPNPQKALQVKKNACSDKRAKGQRKPFFDELKEDVLYMFKLRKVHLI